MLVTVVEQMFWKCCSNNNFRALELCTHPGNNLSNSYLFKKKKLFPGWVQSSSAAPGLLFLYFYF